MDMSATQFKAKCLGVIEKVQKEKLRVTITRWNEVQKALQFIRP